MCRLPFPLNHREKEPEPHSDPLINHVLIMIGKEDKSLRIQNIIRVRMSARASRAGCSREHFIQIFTSKLCSKVHPVAGYVGVLFVALLMDPVYQGR